MVKLKLYVLLPERLYSGCKFSTCNVLCTLSVSKLVALELAEAIEFIGVGGPVWFIWCMAKGGCCKGRELGWVGLLRFMRLMTEWRLVSLFWFWWLLFEWWLGMGLGLGWTLLSWVLGFVRLACGAGVYSHVFWKRGYRTFFRSVGIVVGLGFWGQGSWKWVVLLLIIC